MATVSIPSPMLKLTNNVETVFCSGSTIAEIIDNLDFGYMGIRDYLCLPSGELRPLINIFVDQVDIRFSGGMDTVVRDINQISIITGR